MSHPLDHFIARASIDFITIGRHLQLPLIDGKGARASLPHFDGRIELPRKLKDANTVWLTVHDPTERDLQTIVDHFHDAMLEALEISIDFVPRLAVEEGPLVDLYKWLRHSVAPQKHMQMGGLIRRQYDPATKKYKRLTSAKVLPNTGTFLWEEAKAWQQTRLYIKRDTGRTFVRLEATLKNQGGTHNALIHRVGLLPSFVPDLRRYFSPMLAVGKGFQREGKDIRPHRLKDPQAREAAQRRLENAQRASQLRWDKVGAAGGLKGYRVSGDPVANAAIGTALRRLSDRLKRLHEPEKVADFHQWKEAALGEYAAFPVGRLASYRGKRSPR